MLVEGLLVLPLLDEGDSLRIISPLVQFVANAAGLRMRGLHENVQGVNQFFRLAFFGEELRDAHNLGGVLIWHIRLSLPLFSVSDTDREPCPASRLHEQLRAPPGSWLWGLRTG